MKHTHLPKLGERELTGEAYIMAGWLRWRYSSVQITARNRPSSCEQHRNLPSPHNGPLPYTLVRRGMFHLLCSAVALYFVSSIGRFSSGELYLWIPLSTVSGILMAVGLSTLPSCLWRSARGWILHTLAAGGESRPLLPTQRDHSYSAGSYSQRPAFPNGTTLAATNAPHFQHSHAQASGDPTPCRWVSAHVSAPGASTTSS